MKTTVPLSLEDTRQHISDRIQNKRLSFRQISCGSCSILLAFLPYLVDIDNMQQVLIPYLTNLSDEQLEPEKLVQTLPTALVRQTTDIQEGSNHIIAGWVYMQVSGYASGLLVNMEKFPSRSVSDAQVEVQIFGPQAAFTESLENNLAMVQSYLPTTLLSSISMTVGRRTLTDVEICYLEELALPENVNTLLQRIHDLNLDGIIDSGKLSQMIDDNSYSLFPQLILTERPDYVSESLLEGKIAVFVAGSPFAILGPAMFLDFFKSNEDMYIRWQMATFIRLLRTIALGVSLFFTAGYVAALTFHYEMIPSALLVSLARSRSKVPFPPLLEALLLELIIEFLREAGARLPFKVGQTMGIVGGIVIGQAAVAAGFTSNILIMIVALSALATFTIPSYMMNTAVRILRFPIILLAGMWGGYGIMLGACFLLIHLLRQSSLGRPFLLPFYPFRLRGLGNSLIRLPFSHLYNRPIVTQSPDKKRIPDQSSND